MLRRVSPRTQTPVAATILILVIGVVLMLTLRGAALLQLIVASTILPALIYGGIVVLYLCVRKRLERKEGGFSLGRFELPVAYTALVWVAFSIFALVSPSEARIPGLIVLGLIAVGGLYFVWLLLTNRAALETEPVSRARSESLLLRNCTTRRSTIRRAKKMSESPPDQRDHGPPGK